MKNLKLILTLMALTITTVSQDVFGMKRRREESGPVQYQPKPKRRMRTYVGQIDLPVLHKAAECGDLQTLKDLFGKGLVSRVDECAKNGRTAAWYAYFNGHRQIVKYLISKGSRFKYEELEYPVTFKVVKKCIECGNGTPYEESLIRPFYDKQINEIAQLDIREGDVIAPLVSYLIADRIEDNVIIPQSEQRVSDFSLARKLVGLNPDDDAMETEDYEVVETASRKLKRTKGIDRGEDEEEERSYNPLDSLRDNSDSSCLDEEEE